MQWKLIKLRKENGFTQDDLGEMLGLEKGVFGRKERGETEFKLSEIIAIHRIFKVSLDEIFLPPTCILNAEKEKEAVK